MNKKADAGLVILIIILIALLLFGVYYILSSSSNISLPIITFGTTTTSSSTSSSSILVFINQSVSNASSSCPSSTSPNLIPTAINAVTKMSLTGSITGFTINGNDKGSKNLGVSILVSPNDKVDGLVNVSSINGTQPLGINTNNYCNALISKVQSTEWNQLDGTAGTPGTIPCKSSINLAVPLIQMIQDGSAGNGAINTIKDGTGTVNTASTNVSVTANSTAIFSWTFDAPLNQGLCNADRPVLTCWVNSSEIINAVPTISRGTLIFISSNPPLFNPNPSQKAYSWSWDQNFLSSGNPATIYMTLTTSAINPGVGQNLGTMPFCAWNDQDWFKSSITGAITSGFVNENSNNIGGIANVVNTTFYYR